MKQTTKRQQGFTLVELMIATAVFSVVLLVCLAAFVQIGRMYYKGVTTAKAQEVARTVLEDISQNIQFSSGVINTANMYPATNPGWFCVNDKRYVIYRSRELVDASPTATQAIHALQRESGFSATNCPSPTVTPPTAAAVELMSRGMQLQRLQISSVFGSTTYAVGVRIVSADSTPGIGILENNTVASAVTDSSGVASNTRCTGNAGTQFCAVSELTTTVTKRK